MAQKAMQPHLRFPWNILTNSYPKLARFLRMRKHSKEVSDFFVNVVQQTIQFRAENDENRMDYMQLLIDSGLASNQIAALAFDFLSAGYADSTSTLSYCLYELALPENKNIQDKARHEIESVLDLEENGELTYGVLQKMVYCAQIIDGNFGQFKYLLNVITIRIENGFLIFIARNIEKASGGRKCDENCNEAVQSAKY